MSREGKAAPDRELVGERREPLVTRRLSRQARLTNSVAIGLMVLLGVTIIAWYYGRQLLRQSTLKQSRLATSSAQAAAEMALPPLDFLPARIGGTSAEGTNASAGAIPDGGGHTSQTLLSAVPYPTLAVATTELAPKPTPVGLPVTAAPSLDARERRLHGDVYVGSDTDARAVNAEGGQRCFRNDIDAQRDVGEPPSMVPHDDMPGELSSPGAVPIAAQRQQSGSLLLSKGTFIDCTLETAIDSTLPGITSCVTASDTFSSNGRVVLLERGTRLFGQTQGQVQQGAARIYVLWTEARTPEGVIVPLESPGTDSLGRSGLPGTVQRHFWERFGAAILLSTIDGAVQAGVQGSSQNRGTVIYSPGASQDIMTEVLKSTVAIPPTVIKSNGDRIEVLVARDIDFRSVYALHPVDAEH